MIFEVLRDELGIDEPELTRLIQTAPARYKTYPIKKRSGEDRIIAQPAREVKALQYLVLSRVISRLPIHEIGMAYRTGISIRDNAVRHVSKRCILKLDFENFFNSLTPNDLNRAFRMANVQLPVGDARIINKIVFWSGSKSRTPRFLSVGAPSSPTVSNAIMYDLDVATTEIAAEYDVTVTRYADDITASANEPEALIAFERDLRQLIRKTRHPNLRFNEKKRGMYFDGERQMVTGLILTPEGKVSIGRQRKRMISALIHRATLDQLPFEQLNELHGLLAFAYSVEPSFLLSMTLKYGVNVLEFIQGKVRDASRHCAP
jgi:hypothetical protein